MPAAVKISFILFNCDNISAPRLPPIKPILF
jgi:hypothetical protein